MTSIHGLAIGSESMQWFVYALAGITVVYVVFIRPMSKQKKDPLSKGPIFSPSQQRAVEREMQNLLVELSEMARQITAQLDTRSEKLNLLIQEADAKIAELRRLKGESTAPVRPPIMQADEPEP